MKRKLLLSATGAVLVAGCLVLLNLILDVVYVRLDLSQGKIYSLTSASKKILRRLEDPIRIRAYFSKTLPAEYANHRNYAENILKEYRNCSRGKVSCKYINVDDDDGKNEARRNGIQTIRFNIVSKDKFEVREAMLGLTIQHLDKKEVLPFIQNPSNLEYDFTSRIKKLTAERKSTVGFVTKPEALGPSGLPAAVRMKLEENYDVKEIDLEGDEGAIGSDIDALLLLGPKETLAREQVFALDQYLLSGKPVAVALDTRNVDIQSFFARSQDTGLLPWLAGHGIKAVKNFVLDAQNQKVPITQQRGWVSMTTIVDYPPFLISTDLNRENPITRKLDSLALPFCSPLEISTTSASSKVEALAKSSPYSWLKKSWAAGAISLNPFQDFSPGEEDPKGPFVLAAVVHDKFTSFFEAPPSTSAKAGIFLSSATETSRLAVIGTSLFVREGYPSLPANGVFFLNLVDWMAQDPELVDIRSKAVAFRPLREVPRALKTTAKYANLLGGPFVVVGLGILRWTMRKRRKAAQARYYGKI